MKKIIALSALTLALLAGCSEDDDAVASCDETDTYTSGDVVTTSHTCSEIPSSSMTDEMKQSCADESDVGYTSKEVLGTGCPSGAVLTCAFSGEGLSA